VPSQTREAISEVLGGAAPLEDEGLRALLERLSRQATANDAQLQLALRETHQQIVFSDDAGVRRDTRRDAVLELKLSLTRDGKSASLQRERAFPDGVAALAGAAALETLIDQMITGASQRLSAVPAPSGELTIVLPPGADAGVFFHEVCGHPLEGDVVARGGSYLARRLGEAVAESFVEVVDDPTAGTGVGFSLDDEGTQASPARLIQAGRIAEPLWDTASAAQMGRAPNGHARRVSFRHPALPRMSHTGLSPHQGSFEALVRGVRHGLLVCYLTPRHVNLLTGDFSFFVVEAQRIEDGEVGPFVAPCLLRGNGLTALAGIEAVGADLATFHGLKGCGKLDHGPLPVSFANPTVRIGRGLRVDPWA
jgi:TldD protein